MQAIRNRAFQPMLHHAINIGANLIDGLDWQLHVHLGQHRFAADAGNLVAQFDSRQGLLTSGQRRRYHFQQENLVVAANPFAQRQAPQRFTVWLRRHRRNKRTHPIQRANLGLWVHMQPQFNILGHHILQAIEFLSKHLQDLLGAGDIFGAAIFRRSDGFHQIFVPLFAHPQRGDADAFGLGAAGDFHTAAFIAIGATIGEQHQATYATAHQWPRHFLQAHLHAGRHFSAATGFDHADGAFELLFVVGMLARHHDFGAIIERHQRKIILATQLINDVVTRFFDLKQPFAAHRRATIQNKSQIDWQRNISVWNARWRCFDQQIYDLRVCALSQGGSPRCHP